jgi:hypothetical protein
MLLLLHGSERWVVIGGIGICGPWLAAVMTLIYSGAVDPLMGLDAEGSTADELRRMRHRGWMLANGIKIRGNEDIDHLVVSSAGVLVVETKWSRHRWPIGDKNKSFMSDRLAQAVEQVQRNSKSLNIQLADWLTDVPVIAVCVVWSPENSTHDPPWTEFQGCVIVPGPYLREWLESLNQVVLDDSTIEGIWMRIDHQASVRDEDDIKRFGPPRPTIVRAAVEVFVAPFLGAVIATYFLAFTIHSHRAWIDVAAPILLSLLSIAILRVFSVKHVLFRRVAIGVIAVSIILIACYLFVIVRLIVT